MGAADIVPGVSGGTIAFISGIYERLIGALAQFSPALVVFVRQQGFAAVWRKVDGTFLLVLFSGVLVSIFTLSRMISFLLGNYPELVWGFFLGLIMGSIWYVSKAIKQKTVVIYVYMVLGAVVAYLVTSFAPTAMQPTYLNLFVSGSIAICAMILPGVSGSFLLLLLGMYSPVIAAIKGFELVALAVFASGCLVGLISFTHVLNWLLKKYYALTMAVLTGFMVGAINKIWPWKWTLEYRFNPTGPDQPIVQSNITPLQYEALTGEPSHWPFVLLLMGVGFGAVLLLEKMGGRSQITGKN